MCTWFLDEYRGYSWNTICPRNSYPFYIVSYNKKWVTYFLDIKYQLKDLQFVSKSRNWPLFPHSNEAFLGDHPIMHQNYWLQAQKKMSDIELSNRLVKIGKKTASN